MALKVDDTQPIRNMLLLRFFLKLSAGIVHEINNPLQVMMSELALIQSLAEDLEPVVREGDVSKITLLMESVEVIGNQIKRCSKISRELLNFSRKAGDALK
jgi:two-component system, NtrC family, sensor kinase